MQTLLCTSADLSNLTMLLTGRTHPFGERATGKGKQRGGEGSRVKGRVAWEQSGGEAERSSIVE